MSVINNTSNSYAKITLTNKIYTNVRYKYIVFDKEFEIDGYNENLKIVLSLIDTLGFEYYDNISKQDYYFPSEIKEYLEKFRKQYNRNKKISKII